MHVIHDIGDVVAGDVFVNWLDAISGSSYWKQGNYSSFGNLMVRFSILPQHSRWILIQFQTKNYQKDRSSYRP